MRQVHSSWITRAIAVARSLITLLSVGVLAYIVIMVYSDAQTLLARRISIAWGPLLIGEGLLLLFFALQAQGWRLTLARLDGSSLPFSTAFRIWWLSQTGRYLPGKVLTWASRYALVAEHEVSARNILLSLILEHVLTPIGAVLIFALFSLMRVAGLLSDWLWLVIVVVAGLCVLLYPPFLQATVNIGARLRHQSPVQLRLGLRDVTLLISHYALQWVIAGTAFVFFLAALTQPASGDWLALIGVFPLAWTCGFLSIITPGGLGVREVTLGLLLAAFMPASLAAFVAGTSRLWWMVAEGLAFLLALALGHFYHPQPQPQTTMRG